jgi:uncharacterized iron-regulated protein
MKNFYLLAFTSLLLSFTLQKDEPSARHYKIYSSKALKEVKLEDIVADMKNYDVVFFGEEHNDSVAHYLQYELIKGLHASYGDKVALCMEMFETDCQMVLDEYLKDQIREKNFTKEARAWPNYRNYKPMVEFAKEKKLAVIAGNAPSRYVNMAARKGRNSLEDLTATAKSFLPPLPYDTASGAYYEKFMEVMSDGRSAGIKTTDSAKKVLPAANSMMPKYIVHSQSLWDATMAYSVSKIFKKNKQTKVLQLNGRFHSDGGMGTVTQLRKYNQKLRILVISSFAPEKGFPDSLNYEENKKLGDYVIYTDPKVPKTYKQ